MAVAKIPFSKKHGSRFKTGAIPSSKQALAAAVPFSTIAVAAPPPQIARVPEKLDPWGNDSFGDCVSAEEAFRLACWHIIAGGGSEIFLSAKTVTDWARSHGYLNGAPLDGVLRDMERDGFKVGSQQYNAGPAHTVNWSDENELKAAIALDTVKIAIPASCLPSGAGSQQGWYVTSTRGGRTDHCVSLPSYGTMGFLFDALKVPLPSKLNKDDPGYHLYTWSTIGIVTKAWIDAALDEAWVRVPSTVGVPPLAPPVPPTPPGPPKNPAITGVLSVSGSKITGELTVNLPTPTSGTFTYIPQKVAGGYGLGKKPVA